MLKISSFELNKKIVFISFKTIQKNLKNRSWIVTYDKCDEIYQIYKKQKYRIMSLNYSAQNKKKAEEYMFYKNITIKEDV